MKLPFRFHKRTFLNNTVYCVFISFVILILRTKVSDVRKMWTSLKSKVDNTFLSVGLNDQDEKDPISTPDLLLKHIQSAELELFALEEAINYKRMYIKNVKMAYANLHGNSGTLVDKEKKPHIFSSSLENNITFDYLNHARNIKSHIKMKDSPESEAAIVEQIQVQEKQNALIAAQDKPGKNDISYATSALIPEGEQSVWHIPCGENIYSINWYGNISGCSPQRCSRRIRDHVASLKECKSAIKYISTAMNNLFHRGGSTSLVANTPERLGPMGHSLIQTLINRTRNIIIKDYDLTSSLYNSGSLLSRLTAEFEDDEWEAAPNGYAYWNAHVDKANIASYDYSALLYLNSQIDDIDQVILNDDFQNFSGGKFVFIDAKVNHIVAPTPGRLVTFTSGLENLHRVREVTRGTRFVLAMWFTCDKSREYSDSDSL